MGNTFGASNTNDSPAMTKESLTATMEASFKFMTDEKMVLIRDRNNEYMVVSRDDINQHYPSEQYNSFEEIMNKPDLCFVVFTWCFNDLTSYDC